MLKAVRNTVMALACVSSVMAASVTQADAHGRGIGLGIAAGIIGLGVGAAIADAHPRYYSRYREDGECYYGRRECHWTGRRCFENSYGDEVCRGGRYVCERPLICD